MDLLDFFRGHHSWRKLALLIAHLPTASAYVEAVANDEEYARQVISDKRTAAPANPPLSAWSTEVDLLAQILDRLGDVVAATVAAAGHKPSTPRPTLRPFTAIDRARADARLQKHLSLVEEVRQAPARYALMKRGEASP